MSALILIKTIIAYSFPFITLIGLITNSLSFVIFSRKRFQNTIFATYWRFFIVFQSLNLLVLPINKMLEFNFNIYFSRISTFCCKIRNVYPNYNILTFSWILVFISFDRYLSISYPSKFLFRKKSMFQIKICICLIIFNLVYITPTWFYYLKETNSTQIIFNQTTNIMRRCSSPGLWLETFELFQLNLIPFFFMIFFTLLTLKNLFNSRRKINQSTMISSSSSSSSTKQINNDRKFAITSIAINFLFLILNFPFLFLLIINEYTKLFVNLNHILTFLQTVSIFFLYINFTSTFFIHYFANSMFKTELKWLLFGNTVFDDY